MTQGPQEAPEVWKLSFDSRQWRLGYQDSSPALSIREYVLPGETVEAWSELVTSILLRREDVSVKAVFENFKGQILKDCPAAKISVIQQSDVDILFEWQHQGCKSFPPQHEIKRITRGPGGILVLSYVAKTTSLAGERRTSWISILGEATPKTAADQPATPKVPGASIVNMADLLRKGVLANLVSFARKTYGCGSVNVISTRSYKADDKNYLDGKGHFLSLSGWQGSLSLRVHRRALGG
jgi:hypothetical protein